MKNNSRYFENIDCEYYPCHQMSHINCLFCYCPLYLMECGGQYQILDNGIKDCSSCLIPHQKNNYDYIVNKLIDHMKNP